MKRCCLKACEVMKSGRRVYDLLTRETAPCWSDVAYAKGRAIHRRKKCPRHPAITEDKRQLGVQLLNLFPLSVIFLYPTQVL